MFTYYLLNFNLSHRIVCNIEIVLLIDDPYHAYYRHKVKEFIEGKAKEPSVPKPTVVPSVKVSYKIECIYNLIYLAVQDLNL